VRRGSRLEPASWEDALAVAADGLRTTLREAGPDAEARDYLVARCENADALRAAVADFPPERAGELTGLPASAIVEAAHRYATTPRACLVYGLGVTQHVAGRRTSSHTPTSRWRRDTLASRARA